MSVPPSQLLHLALEMVEINGVGNWAACTQFATGGDGGGEDWVFTTGLRDASLLSIYDAVVEAFGEGDVISV